MGAAPAGAGPGLGGQSGEPGSRSDIARAPGPGIIQEMGPSLGTGAGGLGREKEWGTGATLTPAAPAGSWNWDQHLHTWTLALPLGHSRHWHLAQHCPGTGL